MRESSPGILAALAVVLCRALPLLLFTGLLTAGGGFILNQQALVGLGIAVVLLGGLSWLVVKKRR
jgi:hypothetical protein